MINFFPTFKNKLILAGDFKNILTIIFKNFIFFLNQIKVFLLIFFLTLCQLIKLKHFSNNNLLEFYNHSSTNSLQNDHLSLGSLGINIIAF